MNYELYHHGVKGMKWGVRRTPAQLGHKTNKNMRGWSKDAKAAERIKQKNIHQMTNKEIQQLNKRMELEKNYRNLNPNKVKKGLRYTAAVTGGMGTILALQNNSSRLIKLGEEVLRFAR